MGELGADRVRAMELMDLVVKTPQEKNQETERLRKRRSWWPW